MAKRKLSCEPSNHPSMNFGWMSSSNVIPKSELVVAKAKVEACEQFFIHSLQQPHKLHILVVCGPTCSGKTSLVRSVCAELHLDLIPVDDLIDTDYGHSMEDHHKVAQQPGLAVQACLQNSKFPALSLFSSRGLHLTNAARNPNSSHHGGPKKVTFVDDIDSMTETAITNVCKTLKRQTTGIVVLTCADWFAVCKGCRGLRDLSDIIVEIQLNRMAVTFVKAAIKYWGFDSADIPKEMIESGDLRGCLHHVYMKRLCLDHGLTENGGGDENLTIFHALGRLFYPLKQRANGSLFSPFIPDDRPLFLLYIHHNMFPYMASLEEAMMVLESLSLDDHVDKTLLPITECTVIQVINKAGRLPNKVRPGFTRPDYLDVMIKSRQWRE